MGRPSGRLAAAAPDGGRVTLGRVRRNVLAAAGELRGVGGTTSDGRHTKEENHYRCNRFGRHLAVALATAWDPLVGISADVEAALAAFRALLNKLERHYWDSEVYYKMVLTNLGDADSLVCYLSKGLKTERASRERLEAGTPLPEDLNPEEEV